MLAEVLVRLLLIEDLVYNKAANEVDRAAENGDDVDGVSKAHSTPAEGIISGMAQSVRCSPLLFPFENRCVLPVASPVGQSLHQTQGESTTRTMGREPVFRPAPNDLRVIPRRSDS
jgi:hypothetical protein